MFTFLHTSDLHLGLSLYDYEQREEQTSMMAQLRDIVASHRPDAVLISGDIFNSAQPPVWATQLLAEGMMAIRDAGNPEMRIIITAGNHDSATRHEAQQSLWARLGIDMVGVVKEDAPQRLIFEIPGKALVVAVPFVHDRFLPEGFYGRLLDESAGMNAGGLPVVMMAHTAVGSARAFNATVHMKNPDSVGGIDMHSLDSMGTGYDYLALGHIHKPSTFRRADSPAVARYCGTPIAGSFDECFPHSVSFVSIEGHGADARIEIEEIPVSNPRPPVNVPPSGWAPWGECLDQLRRFPPALECYVRVNPLVEGFLPLNARDEAYAALEGKKARFCIINPRRAEVSADDADNGDMGVKLSFNELRNLSPLEVAAMFAQEQGLDLDPALLGLLEEVESEVNAPTKEV